MSEKCVHEWYYRIVDIVSWQFFCIRCGEKLSMDKFSDRATELEKNVDALNDRIAELEAERRWHVVADGDLPNTYKPVLTVDMSEATRIPVPAFYNLDTKCWSTHFECDLWVTHWMPLPESPNDTQKETFVYGKEDSEAQQ